MKRGDWIIAGVIAAAAALTMLLWLLPRMPGLTVTVTLDGETVYTVPLAEERILTLSGNVIEISGGQVRMQSADCKNQICVRHAAISETGDSIICLPNRVVVTIE